MRKIMPTFDQETRLWQKGYHAIAGIDEAGRGALAGPVVAAAVIVPPSTPLAGLWAQVCDSKLLTAARRSELETQIQTTALAWGVGAVAAPIIDQIGIAAATRLAMRDAIVALPLAADYLGGGAGASARCGCALGRHLGALRRFAHAARSDDPDA